MIIKYFLLLRISKQSYKKNLKNLYHPSKENPPPSHQFLKFNSVQPTDAIPYAFSELQLGSQHDWSMPQSPALATEVCPNRIQRGVHTDVALVPCYKRQNYANLVVRSWSVLGGT